MIGVDGRDIYIDLPYLNVLLVPKHWPLWARRLFVLTAPVSAPLLGLAWIALLVASIAFGLIAFPTITGFALLRDLWRADAKGERA